MTPMVSHPGSTGRHRNPPRTRFGLLSGILMVVILFSPTPLSADADNGIPIASIYSLTGPAAPSNRSSVRGVRLAVREINAGGGLLGRRLELLEIDNLSTPIGSKVAADSAVDQAAAAIIGPAYSSHALAMAKVAQANRIPMITSIATHPNITVVGDYIFRVCFNDLLQGEVMGRFARQELDARRVVIAVNLNSDYSIGLSTAFEKTFTRLGGVVSAKLPYKPRQTHFRELIAKVISENPDVLFVPGHNESARIVDEAIGRGLGSTPLGGDGWDQDTFFSKGGNRIKRGYFTTHWHKAIETHPSKQFVDKYGDAEMTTTAAALAYDAVYLIADAIRRAGSVQRSAIRDALAATENFVGVTGRLRFDPFGDPDKSVVIMEIRDGRPFYHQQVYPDRTP